MFDENNSEFNIEPDNTDIPQPQYYSDITITTNEEDAAIKEEKKSIRRDALIVGLPSISLFLIIFFWSTIYLFFTMDVAGMSFIEAKNLSENLAVQQILQIILSCVMFLIPFSIAAKASGNRIDRLILFNKVEKDKILPFLFLGIGFCSFANIAVNFASAIFENFGIRYEVDFGENPKGLFGFLLSFVATAIVPALVEEFACRGVVLGILRKHGEGFAIVTSAIVFGVMHGNFQQIPFATIIGLILGYIYVKTNSIWLCVIVHGINNAISVIFSYLDGVVEMNIQNVAYITYLIISFLLAILGIYLIDKNQNCDFSLKKVESKLTTKEKYARFFSSWIIILFLAVNVLEAIGYYFE